MNPALDKYYESLLQLKGGAKKGRKKSSGKKKKRSGKKKKSSKKKKQNSKRQPRIVDHSIGKNRIDQILNGIPILSPVNPLLTSINTYNPIIPYNDVIPNYSNTATPGIMTGAPVQGAPVQGGVDLETLLVPPDNFTGIGGHPSMGYQDMGAMGHPSMGYQDMGGMEHPSMGYQDMGDMSHPSMGYQDMGAMSQQDMI